MKVTTLAISFLLFAISPLYAGDASKGEKIYLKICKSCHRLSDGKKVGPGFQGVTKRRSEKWIRAWITNPKAMIKKKDKIALSLIKGKRRGKMPKLKIMQKKENRDNIIAFLKKNDS